MAPRRSPALPAADADADADPDRPPTSRGVPPAGRSIAAVGSIRAAFFFVVATAAATASLRLLPAAAAASALRRSFGDAAAAAAGRSAAPRPSRSLSTAFASSAAARRRRRSRRTLPFEASPSAAARMTSPGGPPPTTAAASSAMATSLASAAVVPGDDGPSFASYLSRSSEILSRCAADPRKKVRVVLGNEAGDADSIMSSLALSYVQSLGPDAAGDDAAAAATAVVPVVSVPRADLALRRETVLLLDMCGIDSDGLAYIDDDAVVTLLGGRGEDEDEAADEDEPKEEPGPELELVLTDHNRLRASLSRLSDRVSEIVDHHEDEGSHGHVSGPARDVAFEGGTKAALVGSACTLVAERLFAAAADEADEKGGGSEGEGGGRVDPALALALLGVILLDTVDMSPDAGKGTERDGRALSALLERADWSRLRVDDTLKDLFDETGVPIRSALHDFLRNSKFDRAFWEGMSAHDCLRIDYKRFEPNGKSDGDGDGDGGSDGLSKPPSFGMSSVLLDMDSFLRKPDVSSSLRSFMGPDEANVPLLAVLTMKLVGDTPHREMLLVGKPSLTEAVWEYLLKDPEAEFLEITDYEEVEEGDAGGRLRTVREGLGTEEEGGGAMMAVRRFRQGNAKGSRKQVAPVLLKKMSTLSQ